MEPKYKLGLQKPNIENYGLIEENNFKHSCSIQKGYKIISGVSNK